MYRNKRLKFVAMVATFASLYATVDASEWAFPTVESGLIYQNRSVVQLKPNVMLIMLDDSGWTDFGCFGSQIQTPNIRSVGRPRNEVHRLPCGRAQLLALAGGHSDGAYADAGWNVQLHSR